MANLKQLRNRINSIKSTGKLTKAMQMVAAAKLTKIKHQLGDTELYLSSLANIITNITALDASSNILKPIKKYFSAKNDSKSTVFIVMTSEKGLCGSFNSSTIKNLKSEIATLVTQNKLVKLIVIGRKGYNALKKDYSDLIESYFNISSENSAEILNEVKQKIINMVDKNTVNECYIYFNKFKNTMLQILTKQQILPLSEIRHDFSTRVINYDFEGDNLVEQIVELYINSLLNFAFLESRASEEGARMTAMDNANKNAKDLAYKLTLKLNRTRQANITKDLIEIIAGAESA